MNTSEKLNELASKRARLEELRKSWEAENAELIESIGSLEAEIKSEVLESGETVKGESLMAVWVSGKVTWDGRQLKKFAETYPAILAASKVGNPSVSFRMVKPIEE